MPLLSKQQKKIEDALVPFPLYCCVHVKHNIPAKEYCGKKGTEGNQKEYCCKEGTEGNRKEYCGKEGTEGNLKEYCGKASTEGNLKGYCGKEGTERNLKEYCGKAGTEGNLEEFEYDISVLANAQIRRKLIYISRQNSCYIKF